MNGGTCVNTEGSYFCDGCDSGWEGQLCEKGNIFFSHILFICNLKLQVLSFVVHTYTFSEEDLVIFD
jgi:hypothetical protein